MLALQGDFEAHGAALERAGARAGIRARSAEQFGEIDGLIIPGGESTTMLKLLRYEGLMEPLAEFGAPQADVRHLRRRHPAGQRSVAVRRRRAWD